MKMLLLALATVAALPAAANAQAFTNGSFESGSIDPGVFTTLGTGSTAITGWTVDSGSIDYLGSYWNASDGSRSIDLSGNGPGSISQTFDTIVGRTYRVTFDLGGNGDGGPATKTLDVLANGGTLIGYTAPSSMVPTITYASNVYTFTAALSSTTLTFISTTGTAFGPALDNVAVSAVPEPAAWAMMILGAGFIGGAMRQRRRMVSAIA